MARSIALFTVVCVGCSDPGRAASGGGLSAQNMIAPVQAGPVPTLVVAAGVDATVDASGVTTDANGQPWNGFDDYASGDLWVTTLSAADAEAECDATGCYFDFARSPDDSGDAYYGGHVHELIVPGTVLPDGGATWLWYTSPYWAPNFLQVLLLPAANGDTSIALTADDWALLAQ